MLEAWAYVVSRLVDGIHVALARVSACECVTATHLPSSGAQTRSYRFAPQVSLSVARGDEVCEERGDTPYIDIEATLTSLGRWRKNEPANQ